MSNAATLGFFVNVYFLFVASLAQKFGVFSSRGFWFHSLFSLAQYLFFARARKPRHVFVLWGFFWGFLWVFFFRFFLGFCVEFTGFIVVLAVSAVVAMLVVSLALKFGFFYGESERRQLLVDAMALGWGMHVAVNAEEFGREHGNFGGGISVFMRCLGANTRCLFPLLTRLVGSHLVTGAEEISVPRSIRGASILLSIYLVVMEMSGNFLSQMAMLMCMQVAALVLWWRCRRLS